MGRRRGDTFTLSQLAACCTYFRIRCSRCRHAKVYMIDDLIKLVGDIECDHVERKMWCSRCDRKDDLTGRAFHPTALEMQTLQVRRLVRIDTVKRFIWKDGPA